MRSITLGLAAATLAFGLAQAQQAATPQATPTQPAPAAVMTPETSMSTPATPMPAGGAVHGSAAHNGAVNTNPANPAVPASGSNSFTQGQARHRIMKEGFTKVSALRKDTNGVWRGTAQRDGQTVHVWLDYRGDVGQQ